MFEMFKEGTKVICTLGESVIHGTIRPAGLNIEGTNFYPIWPLEDPWRVEVVQPPLPDKPGSVVLDRFERAWQLQTDGWWKHVGMLAGETSRNLIRYHGPLTEIYVPK